MITILIFLFWVAAATWWRGWTDAFHLAGGAALLAIPLLLVVLRARWRRAKAADAGLWTDDEGARSPWPRKAAFGTLWAAAGVVYLALVGFPLLERIPWLYGGYYDRDRPRLEQRLASLESLGKYVQAAESIKARLASRASPAWRRLLAGRLVDDLTESAWRIDDAEERVSRLREARATAGQFGLDTRLTTMLLAREEKERITFKRIDDLRANRRWADLVELVRSALEDVETRDKPRLAAQLCDALVAWGMSATSPGRKTELFRDALGVAREFKLSQETITSLIGESQAREEEIARCRKQIGDLRAQSRWSELVPLLEAAAREWPRPAWGDPLDQWLLHACCRLGDQATGPAEQVVHYERALRVAGEWKLDPEPARARLDAAKAALSALARRRREEEERARPVALPKQAKAGLIRVSYESYPPALIADLWVEDASGTLIPGLRPNDVRVAVGDRPASVTAIAPVEARTAPLNLVVALDISNSTSGAPLESAKRGIDTLLSGLLGPRREVRILAFNDQVLSVCPWTTDFRGAIHQTGYLQAGGRTALYQAVGQAVSDLEGREGQRRLIVFTDGQDTVGGAELESLLTRCRQKRVVIDCLGLKSDKLDLSTLNRLSQATGGTTVEVASPERLVEQFRAASQALRKSFYRVVIVPEIVSPKTSGPLPIEIRVGGTNSVTASMALDRERFFLTASP
jgi:von Willebrand factor type A domain